MTTGDLARYTAIEREPTHVDYRGLDVYGMGPPSSGGSTVGEALNILEGYRRSARSTARGQLHWFLEASRFAFADRNAYLGRPGVLRRAAARPAVGLVRGRAARADRPDNAATSAASPPGNAVRRQPAAPASATRRTAPVDDAPDRRRRRGQRRVLHVHDRVDRRQRHRRAGLGLPAQQRADRLQLRPTRRTRTAPPAASGRARRWRRRSSSDDGRPFLAIGSPGGSTIITTVLQILHRAARPRQDAAAGDRRAARAASATRRRRGRAGVHRARRTGRRSTRARATPVHGDARRDRRGDRDRVPARRPAARRGGAGAPRRRLGPGGQR